MPENISIPSFDGFEIAATLREGAGDRPFVIINSATAVKQSFYQPLANYLESCGMGALTYDYRGIGRSRPKGSLAGFKADMEDWARDAQAVTDWVFHRFASRQVGVIGHSFGGQCLGLMTGNERFARVLTVAAQSGYWRNFTLKSQPFLAFMWYVAMPSLTAALGYFPAKKLGAGEDLPYGVGRQWADWCKKKDYLYTEFGPEKPNRFLEIRAPIRVYGISDDSYGPPKAVDGLVKFLPQANFERREIRPEDFDKKPIGHFGLFREKFKETVWKEMAEFLGGK